MNPQISSNILAIFTSLIGASLFITPASAQLSTRTGLLSNTLTNLTNTTSTTSTKSITTSNVVGLLGGTSTTISQTTTSLTQPTLTQITSQTSPTPTIASSTSTSPTTSTSATSTSPTQAISSTTSNLVDLLGGTSTTISQTTTSLTQPTLTQITSQTSPTPTIENTAQATAGVELIQPLTATLQETTNTTLGKLGGVSSDSQTKATVADLTQAQLPSLSNPKELIQKTGEATLGINIDKQGVKLDAGADLTIAVARLAQVNICLDANASLGSPNISSLADCSRDESPRKVPEPALLGGLAVMGVYLLSRSGKLAHRRQFVAK